MAVTPVSPVTATGAAELILNPLPSSPETPEPQHLTVPSERSAQVLLPREESLVTLRQVLPMQPPGQDWAGGVMHEPFVHVPWPTSVVPWQPAGPPQAPVGYWHWPSDRPAQTPAQVPLP